MVCPVVTGLFVSANVALPSVAMPWMIPCPAVVAKIPGSTYLVDVPVTALTHLGVRIDPAWQLDGRPVGLR